MAGRICDLHIHSNNSDGVLGVEEIVLKGVTNGLCAVSITDHDTLAGQLEAIDAGRKHGIEVVPGIEFSVEEGGKRLHILGYFIDPENRELVVELERLREWRFGRAEEIMGKLRKAGVRLTMADVTDGPGMKAIGRPHIAMALYKKGIVSSYNEAFNRFLADGACCYVPKKVLPAGRVVELIRSAGGVAVWAHPGWEAFDDRTIERLMSLGIEGIEVWHPNHSAGLEANILSVAVEKDLVPTGGSDYHTDEAEQVRIGGKGAPRSSLERLRERAALR